MQEKILPSPRLLPKKRRGDYCAHLSVYVVEETRQLECRKCGCVISPFDYLMRKAVKQNNVDLNIRVLMAEEKRLRSQVEDLKRQIKNLKQQASRLSIKSNDNR